MKKIVCFFITFFIFTSPSMSAISIDRTRVIFNGDNNSMTLSVYNKNGDKPYLAQSWIESETKVRITQPFVVTPPIQRIDAGERSQIQIDALPSIASLPQDRESLFYFNVREIPPKPNKANTLQLALQTQVKLFYRPKSIVLSPTEVSNNPWQDKILITRDQKGFHFENPTPYYITILDMTLGKEKLINVPMVPPFSSTFQDYPNALKTNQLSLIYINDFGGRVKLSFVCSGASCKLGK